MTQPTPPVLLYDFSSELGTEFGLHLDANFDAIVTSLDETIANLALIQRDDGAIRNQTVHSNAFTSDALALMAGSSVASTTVSWLPRGTWLTATLYNVGNIIETGSPATAYVCSVQHTSGVFATDYAAHKWVVLSAPRTLISADVTGALGFTPVNKAGDTMTGALTLVTASNFAGMTISNALMASQDLLTIDKGFYSAYASAKSDIVYGFAANVVRTAGDYLVVGAQTSAIGAGATTGTMFGSNFNAVGLNSFAGALVGQEIDIASFDPSNQSNKWALNIVFANRAGANPGQYSYTFPNAGTYTNAGAGLGANFYNKNAVAIQIDSNQRSATGEWCGWTRGLRFGEYSLDSETDAAYASSRAYPIGIDFSALHYYGGTDPVTAFNLESAIALRDFQTIWWNRDPATAASAVNKVKTFFNPATSRWVITNGGAEMVGFDVTNGAFYQGGSIVVNPGLALNNVWTAAGSNTFQGPVTVQENLTFSGNSRRIKGDFSNATVPYRTMVQTTAGNSSTEFGLIPSGTAGESAFFCMADADAADTQVGRIAISTTQFQINSGIVGAGAYVPMTFAVSGAERMRIDSATGMVIINSNTFTNAIVKLRVNGVIQCDDPVAFSVHRAGVNFAVANNVPTAIDWTTEVFDTSNAFNLATDRFLPLVAGKYALMGAVCNAAGTGVDTGAIVCAIYKNGVQEKSGNFATMSGAGATGSHVSCIVDANGTDYFQLYVVQVTGAPLTCTGAATDTYFQGYRIG